MRVRYLRYALAVAEHGSFRRAARSLGIDCSVLSRRVRDLEARLGLPLFYRGPGGAALTEAGRQFVPQAQSVLDQIGSIFTPGLARRQAVERYSVRIYIEPYIIEKASTYLEDGSGAAPKSERPRPSLAFTIEGDSRRNFEEALHSDRHRAEALVARAISDVVKLMQGIGAVAEPAVVAARSWPDPAD